ncbi:hypothetical protein ILUMI_00354 [Ignelater luminosus]|uniref:Uncharacterized protein n=1 Tax=Ignelater luminosus TaxID=2038154 RepID=A0A8K0GQB1_IGNLU|nr:hypothetical protein ILUMI_00354 [Ignelater luminosus]
MNKTGFYPPNGLRFGQNFLCISLDVTNLNKVGVQLEYNEANVFYKNVPEHLKSVYFNYIDPHIAKTHRLREKKLEKLSSLQDITFFSFAKKGSFRKDLYLDWVAPTLHSNLYVQTWLNSKNPLPSNCNKNYSVNNVEHLRFNQFELSFKTTIDHSKWAVSARRSPKKWICIGDVNRASRQTMRGGGTVCFTNKNVVHAYQSIVVKTEECEHIQSIKST